MILTFGLFDSQHQLALLSLGLVLERSVRLCIDSSPRVGSADELMSSKRSHPMFGAFRGAFFYFILAPLGKRQALGAVCPQHTEGCLMG